jgi:tRNA A-37 threonylcarbamoyl transferase component Bud32
MTGRVIAGRYNLQHAIGRGAMGVVWRARDQLLDREVAIKEVVISALIGEDERRNAYQRTLREARTAARLSHRGVVTIYDVVEEDARPWIVMELVPSQSLDQLLTAEGRLPTARAGRIGQQLLSALAAAHAAGVLHRDVKPSNVLIAATRSGDGWDERAVLTDFGIAQFEGDPRLTQTGMVMGSPGFTAPERIRGGDATPGSDLWSLGATIYAAVEGRGPFEQRGGAITTMSAIINEDAPVAPHAGRLAPLIAALLRRDPSARPTASAAARMFAQVLPQLTDTAEAPPSMTHPATIRSSYVPEPSAAPADSGSAVAGEAGPAAPDPATPQQASREPAGAAQPAGEPAIAADAVPAQAGHPASGADTAAPGAVAAEASRDESVPAGETAEGRPAVAPEARPPDSGAADQPPSAGTDAPAPASPGADPIGYQPTQLSIPVARAEAAAPARPQPADPPTEPKHGPSFTASGPADRAAPTFSANQAPPARPSTPASDQRPPHAAGGGPGGYGASPQGGYGAAGTAPMPSGGGQYQPPGGQFPIGGSQYAGPSQPYPDLARDYQPGAGGGGRRGRGGSGRGGKRIAWLAAAVVVAIGAGVGAALALNNHGSGSNNAADVTDNVPDTTTNAKSVNALNDPTAAVPAGWHQVSLSASELHSTAGFSVALPPGWKESRDSLATNFNGPGNLLLTIDLTPQPSTNMLTAAGQLEKDEVAAGRFPGYKRQNLEAVPVRNTHGAFWKFHWQESGKPQYTADDILFRKQTPAGEQDYALYIRSPTSTFGSTALPLFDQILRTFQTVPASTTQPPVTTSPTASAT